MEIGKIIASLSNEKIKDDYLNNPDMNFFSRLNFNIRSKMYNTFGVWEILDFFPYKVRQFYWDKVRIYFKPQHTRLRKAIPKTWVDLSHLIVVINFEIVKSFYEDEYSSGCIDWNSDNKHKEFANWLETIYYYITTERPDIEKQLDNAYPETTLETEITYNSKGEKTYKLLPDKKPYEILYKDVIRLESILEERDTKFLNEIIKYRDFFWT